MGIIWETDFSNHWIFGLFHATLPRWPQPAQGGPRAKLHVLGFQVHLLTAHWRFSSFLVAQDYLNQVIAKNKYYPIWLGNW